jgi:taurine dioxygenase
MTIVVQPTGAAAGARITGIDLSQDIDAKAFDIIHQAWLDHQMLVFPDQYLSEEDQIRFSRHWGELPVRDRYRTRQERDVKDQSIMLVSNIRENGREIGSLPDGEMMFHTDGAYDRDPYRYTLLYAVELPATGGNTLFADMYAAYDTLPDDLKRRLAGCTAEHGYYSGTVQKDQPGTSYNGDFIHPVFVQHEETGRTALFVSRLLTLRIVEMEHAESDEVLEALFDHCEQSSLIYEHVWTKGDFVMWDNRCLNHARTDFPETERRLLRRTVVQGVQPKPASVSEAA